MKLASCCLFIFYVHIFPQKMIPCKIFPVENKMKWNIAVQRGGKSLIGHFSQDGLSLTKYN